MKVSVDWNRTPCTAYVQSSLSEFPGRRRRLRKGRFLSFHQKQMSKNGWKWHRSRSKMVARSGRRIRVRLAHTMSYTFEINADLGDCVLKQSITKLETSLQSPSMRNTSLPPWCSLSASEALSNSMNHLWTYSCIYSIESEKYVYSEGECIRSTPCELIIDYYLTFRDRFVRWNSGRNRFSSFIRSKRNAFSAKTIVPYTMIGFRFFHLALTAIIDILKLSFRVHHVAPFAETTIELVLLLKIRWSNRIGYISIE